MANKMEVVLLGGFLGDPMACAMLPDIAFLTSNAMSAIILAITFSAQLLEAQRV